MGYSITGDFNNFLMLFSVSLLIPENIKGNFLNGFFLIFSSFALIKLLIFIALYPSILTYEDDPVVKEKKRIYSKFILRLLYLIGILIAFPLSFYSIWILNDIFLVPAVQSNSMFIFLILSIMILHLLYLIVSLITISTVILESYHNKDKNSDSKLSFMSIEIKIIIYFALILCLCINSLYFMNLFSFILL